MQASFKNIHKSWIHIFFYLYKLMMPKTSGNSANPFKTILCKVTFTFSVRIASIGDSAFTFIKFSRTVAESMAMCGHDEVVTVERNSRTDAEPKAMCDPAEGVTVERKSRTVPEPSYV